MKGMQPIQVNTEDNKDIQAINIDIANTEKDLIRFSMTPFDHSIPVRERKEGSRS